ncbi:hypothetical protein PXD56_01255 [Maribacter sp. SA7]|uniref:hypothetical protein n=1 Tax=Maribacter zhoushanensis TaxID=3030012 RepID=UPI0023ED9E5A|nr:hypothetical protein [Maribacter zhoushanensis]MDF4201561.1 hypothetical protein [Maribacter zhoushanensis]
MKRIRDLELFKQIKEIREFEFGRFYFFKDGIIISEINEGVIFKWENAKRVINASKEIYDGDLPVVYLSNRINKYYVVSVYWLEFYKNRYNIAHYAVVGSTKGSFLSLFLERLFFGKSIARFQELDQAVEWAVSKAKI